MHSSPTLWASLSQVNYPRSSLYNNPPTLSGASVTIHLPYEDSIRKHADLPSHFTYPRTSLGQDILSITRPINTH